MFQARLESNQRPILFDHFTRVIENHYQDEPEYFVQKPMNSESLSPIRPVIVHLCWHVKMVASNCDVFGKFRLQYKPRERPVIDWH